MMAFGRVTSGDSLCNYGTVAISRDSSRSKWCPKPCSLTVETALIPI